MIELKAYRIGESLLAPKFEIVEISNDFVKNANTKSSDKTLNRSQAARYDFWTRLIEYSSNSENSKISILKNRKANTDDWRSVSIGTSKAHLEIKLNDREHCIKIVLYIRDDKELYYLLEGLKSEIESETGELVWRYSDSLKKAEIIYEVSDELNFDDDSNYNDLMAKILGDVVRLKDIYIKYLKKTGNL